MVRECVRHFGSEAKPFTYEWCAVKGNRRPNEEDFNVRTLCGFFVILPLGLEKRKPTCPDCLKKLRRYKRTGSSRK